MKHRTQAELFGNGAAAKRREPGFLRQAWRRIRRPLAESDLVKHGLAWLAHFYLRFVYATNRPVEGSHDVEAGFRRHQGAIFVLWHGQHLLAPRLLPNWLPLAALFSRSPDAELNALVAETFGMEAVRGSGGDPDRRTADKGGARALIALKNRLGAGKSAALIADIRHAPRQATLGSLTLARISGRPVVPLIVATSRRWILKRSWDRTAVNLPFGRICVIFASPVEVPRSADSASLEALRTELTDRLNRATAEAYQRVDGTR